MIGVPRLTKKVDVNIDPIQSHIFKFIKESRRVGPKFDNGMTPKVRVKNNLIIGDTDTTYVGR